MQPDNGSNYLLDVDKKATPALTYPTAEWGVVGGAQDLSVPLSLDTAETTDKDSNGWEESIATKRSLEISSDHLIELGDEGAEVCRAMLLNRTKRLVRVRYPDGSIYFGFAFCTAFEESAPAEDVATLSLTFKITGEWAKAPVSPAS